MGSAEATGERRAEEIARLHDEVSRLREIERRLTRSERNLKEAEQLAKLGHWELDLATGTLVWSDEIYRIFNLEPQEFGATYEAFLEAIHPDDRELVNKAYTEAVRDKTRYEVIHRLLLRDGTIKHVHERCHTEYGPDGTPLRSLGTVLDITERYRLEEELLRTRKLESVGVLAGGIAHDFNNLLAGILGNADLARQLVGGVNRAAGDLLAQIIEACTRAQDLARQLLTFSRGGEPVKTELSLEPLVTDVTRLVLTGTNVKPSFEFADDLDTVEADGGQLRQVIQQLVLNAREAMPEGGTVRISCRNVHEPPAGALPLPHGRYVQITIEDSGVGIPVKHLDKIFDPYFTTKGHGGGLGLSITHSIVTRHHGHIAASSHAAEGTRMDVYLPSTGKRAAEAQGPGAAAPRKPGGRVLVMDDEEIIRQMSRRILRHLGYEVECTGDVAETLSVCARAIEAGTPFDVVVMDLTIPGGPGGKEAAPRLLALDPRVRLIVSSGYSNDPVMANCGQYGFKAVIPKPYTVQELDRVIASVMDDR